MTTIVRIPEIKVEGKPLGRHIEHDPRSKSFRVAPRKTQASTKWRRRSPILDQGQLGSCTGNASDGVLGTDPFFGSLPTDFDFSETTAVSIYELATQLDNVSGQYPPTDTGSTGLAAAKACKQKGFISGYTHAFSIDDVINGLQSGPAITGISWFNSFDTPDANGVVSLPSNAYVRGGHEVEIIEVDMTNELFTLPNSWGPGWGLNGYFKIPFGVYEKLLAEGGDATFFVPLSQPAPTPSPDVTKTFTSTQLDAIDKWADQPHWWHLATVAAEAWKAAK